MAKRVFELARELGVTSKDVLTKCRAEGIELKNHMSAISAGLAATIQEWFSEIDTGTAVETAQHVDLAAARRKAAAQRKRRKKAEAEAEAAKAPPAEVVAEAPAVEAVAEAPAPAEAVAEAPVAAAEAPAPPVEAVAPPVEEAPPEAPAVEEPLPELEPEPTRAVAVPNVPERPEVVKPAGPQVVPEPAKLHGPQVVRFEGLKVDIGSGRPSAGAGAPPRGSTVSGRGGEKAGPIAEEEGKPRRKGRRSPRRRGGRAAEPAEGTREWRDRDLAERSERLAAATGGTLRRHRTSVSPRTPGRQLPVGRPTEAEIEEPITVKSLSAAAGIKIGEIIKHLLGMGVMATINQTLERDVAEGVALEYGIGLKVKEAKSAEDRFEEELVGRLTGEGLPRAPVVTFLGHVDHGKTSLLDRIREAAVVDGEEGGITQHIGAYRYDHGDSHVVFLDTPGHEAFTAMRARGAKMTDVVVLVVAADDGVMPQTVEAISHAKAAEVPIVVALNKIDLPNANIQRVLGQLGEQGLQPREWGGPVEVIQTSATTGEGIEALVELLSLEAELLELKANPEAQASGYVVEAMRDPSRGVLTRLLVKDGTLKIGDAVICGQAHGRARSIMDDRGRPLPEALPATPVEVTGMDEVPEAGTRFFVVPDLGQAKTVAEERRQRQRVRTLTAAPQASLEDIFGRIEAGRASQLQLILKADVQGSLEALLSSIAKLGNEEVKVQVLHEAVGGITEGDVLLAEASQAIILGFRVVADTRARALADQKRVDVRTYRVIYRLVEDLQQAVVGMLAPDLTEEITGRAEVRELFKISRVGTIAGCFVTEGEVTRNSKIRIIRDNVVIEDGRELDSLKRFKEDTRDVRAGLECGMKFAGFDDVKVGDVIEAYQVVEVARSI